MYVNEAHLHINRHPSETSGSAHPAKGQNWSERSDKNKKFPDHLWPLLWPFLAWWKVRHISDFSLREGQMTQKQMSHQASGVFFKKILQAFCVRCGSISRSLIVPTMRSGWASRGPRKPSLDRRVYLEDIEFLLDSWWRQELVVGFTLLARDRISCHLQHSKEVAMQSCHVTVIC